MKYKILESFEEAKNAQMIRQIVFVDEQGFQNEFDDIDHHCYHFELYDDDNQPIGCARMYSYDQKTYILGRIAILKEYRGMHYGAKIIELLEAKAKELKALEIELSAQVRASSFYEKQGYQKYGEEYLDEYCPHIKMRKQLLD